MTKTPSISVVMPVYNCARYLQEAIESILHQTFQDFEFLIINDGSTDMSTKILANYAKKDSRIKIINQPKNIGLIKTLNEGVNKAKGDWIFRMDSDDISLPDRFALQINAVKENDSLILISGGAEVINEKGKVIKELLPPSKHENIINNLIFGEGATIIHPTVFFKKKAVIKVGGYDERFPVAEDIALWFRLSTLGKFTCIPISVLKLRKHSNNVSVIDFRKNLKHSIAAKICYLRIKTGLSDPSLYEKDKWEDFLNIIDKKLEKENFYKLILKKNRMREIYYSSDIIKYWKLIKEIFLNPFLLDSSLENKHNRKLIDELVNYDK